MKIQATLLAGLIGLALQTTALAELDSKGVTECRKDPNCPSYTIVNAGQLNLGDLGDSGIERAERPGDAVGTPAAEGSKVMVRPAAAKPADLDQARPELEIAYRYSGPGGNGRERPLKDGATLHSGDEFVVDLVANADIHLYIMHYDAHGQVHELLHASGQPANRLSAGTRLTLPGPDQHFTLDNRTGQETFHTIITNRPLPNLLAEYERAVRMNEITNQRLTALVPQGERLQTKGIFVEKNLHLAAGSDATASVCLAADQWCRDSFVIHHRGR